MSRLVRGGERYWALRGVRAHWPVFLSPGVVAIVRPAEVDIRLARNPGISVLDVEPKKVPLRRP